GIQPYHWSALTALPPGLTLSGNTIAGIPTQAGSFTIPISLTDSSPASPITQTFSIVIAAPLIITTQGLPSGVIGQPYQAALNASGGIQPYTWTYTGGALPPGLSLNGNFITGIPTGTPAN